MAFTQWNESLLQYQASWSLQTLVRAQPSMGLSFSKPCVSLADGEYPEAFPLLTSKMPGCSLPLLKLKAGGSTVWGLGPAGVDIRVH